MPTPQTRQDPDRSTTTAGVPRTSQPLDPARADRQTAEKLAQSQLEYQNSLGLTQNIETVLHDHSAYVWKKDENENLLVRSRRDDTSNPRNWPKWKKYGIVILASTLNNLVTICVSGYSTAAGEMGAEFGFGSEVGTLGLSTFIFGFAFGAMPLAPLSEYFGRRNVYLISWLLFVLFQIPIAVAQNTATVLVCRFFGGFFGAAPLANTGGVVHDLFGIDEGGLAVGIYALSSTDGPPFGNAISGFITQEKGFRWLFYVFIIIFGAFWFIIFFFLPETRDTIVLAKKTKKMRAALPDVPFYAEHEVDKKDPRHLWKISLLRPFKFMFTEPITYLSAAINGFIYGVIFLSNEAFPLVFGAGNGGHGWTSIGLINLTFLSYAIGAIIGFCLQPLQEAKYRAAVRRNGGVSDPEARWWSSLWGTALIPLGLMIAAWTSFPFVPFIAPIIGFGIVGIGFYIIIAAILNYVVDGYGHYSASALGGVVFVRNIVGAIFPLFASYMFKGMGNQWALFLLSMVSFFMVPIPFYFYKKGSFVRKRSPYCAEHFGKD